MIKKICMNKSLHLLLAIILSAFFVISCSSPVNNGYDLKKENRSAATTTKTKLTEFYKLLSDEKYEECLNYFSSTLLSYPGAEALKTGLKSRNKTNGLTVQHEILYQTKRNDQNIGDLIVFHTKCFTLEGTYHFENIAFLDDENNFKIEIYEYSNLPYVSLEKANDTASQINIFLTEIYRLINKNKFDDILPIIDTEVITRLGLEKIKIGFEKEAAKIRGITNFEVENISSEMLENIPVVIMTINAINPNGNYKNEITLSCRSEGYKFAFIKAVKDNLLDAIKDESSDVNYDIQKELKVFYNNLSDKNYKSILNSIDKLVFTEVDENTIKTSFINRNEHYGVPQEHEIRNYEEHNISGRKAYDIQLIVNNKNGIMSSESLTFILSSKGEIKLYAYKYSEYN